MLEIRERATGTTAASTLPSLNLVFHDRQRSRLRTRLSTGEEAALLLPRGSLLRGGDVLVAGDGRHVLVIAAKELVSTARSRDAHALLKAAYHLGNRHVPLEVGPDYLRYAHDHVLDEMLRELGLSLVAELSAFEPEGGAYTSRGAAHTHHHSHAQGQGHEHAHEHDSRPAHSHPGDHTHGT